MAARRDQGLQTVSLHVPQSAPCLCRQLFICPHDASIPNITSSRVGQGLKSHLGQLSFIGEKQSHRRAEEQCLSLYSAPPVLIKSLEFQQAEAGETVPVSPALRLGIQPPEGLFASHLFPLILTAGCLSIRHNLGPL